MNMKANDSLIEVSQEFNCKASIVWESITNLEEMKIWFFENLPEFELTPGFKTQFEVQSESRIFTHIWEVIDVDTPNSYSVSWTYKEYPGEGVTTFIVEENGENSILKLHMQTVEDFPEDVPEFKRESCIAGWNWFIKERLVDYLS